MKGQIVLAGLKKAYGKKCAISGLSLSIGSGQIVGLLGPNGSGKTTLLKILAGLIRDYEGVVSVCGMPVSEKTKALVSFLPDHIFLPPWGTPAYAVAYYSDFFADFDAQKAKEMLARFGIDPGQKMKNLSKGMQEKLQIVLAMCRRASVYLLDEPLGGVDPAARAAILDWILENYSEEACIVLSTHLISEVERIFDRVILLREGAAIVDDEVDALRQRSGKSVDALFREVFQC